MSTHTDWIFETSDYFGLDVAILSERGAEDQYAQDRQMVAVLVECLNDRESPGVITPEEVEARVLPVSREGNRRDLHLFGSLRERSLAFNGHNRDKQEAAEQERVRRLALANDAPLRCSRCGEEKPDGDFPHEASKVYRRQRGSYCFSCKALSNHEYAERQRDMREAA